MRKLGNIALMFAVGLGISITLMFLFELFGIDIYLAQNGINYVGLFVFCMLFGFAGSFISLFLSKRIVKWTMRIQIVDPSQANGEMMWLTETVRRLAQSAGLPETPEVGVYDSPEMNAFATGPSKSDSLVAVSTGLLASMNRAELEGVLAHEVAHIANGDMVRMTLMQGVINTLVMFAARIVAHLVASRISDRDSYFMRFALVMFFQIAFGFLGMIVVNWYSRKREFRADSGGAALAGKDKMIAGLQALKDRMNVVDNSQPQLAALKISSKPKGFAAMFSTHPPLAERIEALRIS